MGRRFKYGCLAELKASAAQDAEIEIIRAEHLATFLRNSFREQEEERKALMKEAKLILLGLALAVVASVAVSGTLIYFITGANS